MLPCTKKMRLGLFMPKLLKQARNGDDYQKTGHNTRMLMKLNLINAPEATIYILMLR